MVASNITSTNQTTFNVQHVAKEFYDKAFVAKVGDYVDVALDPTVSEPTWTELMKVVDLTNSVLQSIGKKVSFSSMYQEKSAWNIKFGVFAALETPINLFRRVAIDTIVKRIVNQLDTRCIEGHFFFKTHIYDLPLSARDLVKKAIIDKFNESLIVTFVDDKEKNKSFPDFCAPCEIIIQF